MKEINFSEKCIENIIIKENIVYHFYARSINVNNLTLCS